jgi:hypothetical protein
MKLNCIIPATSECYLITLFADDTVERELIVAYAVMGCPDNLTDKWGGDDVEGDDWSPLYYTCVFPITPTGGIHRRNYHLLQPDGQVWDSEESSMMPSLAEWIDWQKEEREKVKAEACATAVKENEHDD